MNRRRFLSMLALAPALPCLPVHAAAAEADKPISVFASGGVFRSGGAVGAVGPEAVWVMSGGGGSNGVGGGGGGHGLG